MRLVGDGTDYEIIDVETEMVPPASGGDEVVQSGNSTISFPP